MTSGRALIAALAAFVIGVATLPGFVAAQTEPAAAQVPTPNIRPKKAPNPNAALPAPPAATTAAKSGGGQPAAVVVAGEFTHGRVIVLRGLYNIFSRGMDKIAKDMEELGLPVALYNHSRWQTIAAKLIEDYKADPQKVVPIILVGHSLGGDASIVMSNWLALNGVPVRFVVVFDAVAQTHPLIGGIQEVMNFYKPKGYGQEVKAAPSFKGVITNVDLTDRKDIDHLNIDKDPVLQAEVIARVVEILNESTGKPAKKKSAPPVAAAPPAAPAAATATQPAAAPGTEPASAEQTAPAAAAAPPPPAEPAATAAAPPVEPVSTPAAATPPPDPTPAAVAATPPAPVEPPAAAPPAPAVVIEAEPEPVPAAAPAAD